MPSSAIRSMIGRGHAAPLPSAIGTEVTVAGIVGHDEENVGLVLSQRQARDYGQQECGQYYCKQWFILFHLDLQVDVS